MRGAGRAARRGRSPRRRLGWGLGITLGFAAVEAAGGYLSGSLALLADAAHMLADAAALGMALAAAVIAERPHTPRATYGFHRAEILAALANALLLALIVLRIAWEAIGRIVSPPPVAGGPMLAVASAGLAVNLLVLGILHPHGGERPNLNLRAAAAHVFGDLAGSVAAVVAGLLVYWGGHLEADPIASLVVSGVIAWSAWRVLGEATAVLLEVAPRGVDPRRIRAALEDLPGVIDVHDLHVWSITPDRIALSVHLRVERTVTGTETLKRARALLRERFGIYHATIQIEPPEGLASGHRLPAYPAE
ncbi:MAG: cation transporter [Acidobacteria bacterium]|nr:MAG: cation transporter [Acidobacteriota bacterium]